MRGKERANRAGWSAIILAIACLSACGSSSSDEHSPKAPPSGPFAVSDYFTASPTLQDASKLTIHVNQGCKVRPESALGACYRFEFLPGASGALWQYPAGNFGAAPGLPLPPNLTRVSFWAAVNDGSTQAIQFGAGYPTGERYADAFGASTTVTVSADWQRFEIQLPDPSPTSAVGAFSFLTLANAKVTLYLDGIVYE